MDYNNPNDYWPQTGYDPYKGMTDDERMKAGCLQVIVTVVGVIIGIVLCALFGSCTTTKYVPVTETRTEHHWHTDSVRQRDSTHTERETVIRELDSAAMARYGIQMESNQRGWLVLQREMENRLRELEHMTAQRDTVRDSIPVPYPVEKQVPAELTWWQQTRLHLADIMLYLLAVVAIFYVGRKLLRKVNPMP
jgi:hypothetical protein